MKAATFSTCGVSAATCLSPRRCSHRALRRSASIARRSSTSSAASSHRRIGEKRKLLANRRRRLRRLEEIGPVRFEVATCPKVAEALLTTAMTLKRAWALKTGHFARAAFDARFEAAFREALTANDPLMKLRVSSLTCGERVIGVEVSLACARRLFGHVLAHDPDLCALGVGALLAEILDPFRQGGGV